MSDHSTEDNVVELFPQQDTVFKETYADTIMALQAIMNKHDKLKPDDWVLLLASLTGQLIFNADPVSYRTNFINGVAGMISGIARHRNTAGMRAMSTREFLDYVQLPK